MSFEPVSIGIIGCGHISDAYLTGGARSSLVQVKAIADLDMDVARAKAAAHGVRAESVDGLLADPDIEIVVNLTVPLAHAEVDRRILDAGKHVYSEKPLAASFAEGEAVMELAAREGLSVGCAPDTFMGGAHQAARRAIDEGVIGAVVAGHAAVQSHGMESWHPNPAFFFEHGGGPIHDIGPYYITQLVNLLGPVERVASHATKGFATRTVTSEPRRGTVIEVEVPTTVNGVLAFANGANLSITASWDVWKHDRRPMELYGTEGSMLVPDPNFFGGEVLVSERDGEWRAIDIGPHPFGAPTRKNNVGDDIADYRMIGLVDMAVALRAGRDFRASGARALHVLEVMEALLRSSAEGRHIELETVCTRPEPVPQGTDERVFL